MDRFSDAVSRFGEDGVEILRGDRVEAFTYRQLHDMASARASWLMTQGIRAGDRVAILA